MAATLGFTNEALAFVLALEKHVRVKLEVPLLPQPPRGVCVRRLADTCRCSSCRCVIGARARGRA